MNRLLIKFLYPKSNSIVAISRGVKRDLIENFKIRKNKIVVIYNPVDIKSIYNKASEYIRVVEERQGLAVACLEEIAYNMGYINKIQALILAKEISSILLLILF